MSLAGKVAIVTGGSRGIGAGIAIELAKRGAKVLITYISNVDKANEVISAIAAGGGEAKAVQAASADESAPETIINAALQFEGGIDIIVNNAGICPQVMLKNITYKHFDDVVHVNMRFPIFLVQACLPYLRKGGRIVNLGSIFGRQPWAGYTVASATKAAMENFSRQWALELGHEYGVTVNTIIPGPVATDMLITEGPPEVLSAMNQYFMDTPAAARSGKVEDIVPIVAFLCEEQSRWVTGSTVCANGGAVFV